MESGSKTAQTAIPVNMANCGIHAVNALLVLMGSLGVFVPLATHVLMAS